MLLLHCFFSYGDVKGVEGGSKVETIGMDIGGHVVLATEGDTFIVFISTLVASCLTPSASVSDTETWSGISGGGVGSVGGELWSLL